MQTLLGSSVGLPPAFQLPLQTEEERDELLKTLGMDPDEAVPDVATG